ncbi:MAG: ABC transporter ATP-binding protein [Lachnospiraceae bacterium]|nr:ABC transporter ATP-binding protein [Lachnospiraceae bacterium]
MIEIRDVSKRFDSIEAIRGITAQMEDGSVFGLVGTNGAGKSTLLRMIAGVIKPDAGGILIDGSNVYENEEMKKELFYISDEQYFFPSATPEAMRKFYASLYERFDNDRFYDLMQKFNLKSDRRIVTFSKGMKKQLSVILGVCANTRYLLCDETFDGLDPVMRQAVKRLFAADMADRNMTPIIASHNLRELEDICDHVGLLHQGGILFSRDMDDMKLNIHKVQCVFENETDKDAFLADRTVLTSEQRGSLYTFTIRGTLSGLEERIAEVPMVFAEILPLSLEEIFISETEVVGYDIKNIME